MSYGGLTTGVRQKTVVRPIVNRVHVFELLDGDGRYFGAKYKIAVTLRRKMSKTDNIYNTAAVMSNLESVAFESQSFYTVVD